MQQDDDQYATQADSTTRTPSPRCDSAFDRWCCGLPAGHDGVHLAETPISKTFWSDGASGMDLRDL